MTSDQRKQFVDACRRAQQYGLLRCSSGNLSWRMNETTWAVTASGAWLGELRSDQISICCLSDGTCIDGPRPSVESRFHGGVFALRPDVNVVFHFQSPCATAIACGDPAACNFFILPEMPVYLRKAPAVVDYLPPGSEELAQAVITALKDHDLAFLLNHGLVTVGRDFNDALQKASFFELICHILLHNPHARPLSPEAISDVLARTSA